MKINRILAASTLVVALALPAIATEPLDPSLPTPTAPAGEVSRATFTTAVMAREPIDTLEAIAPGSSVVAYFSELKGMEGQRVVHRWEYEGEVMGEVAFDVAGPRWRVHSTKQLDPSWVGAWTVKVLDAQGKVVSQDEIRFETAVATTPATDEAPPAVPAQ